jgi:hypothetical protein
MIPGSEAIVLKASEYEKLVTDNSKLERTNDALNTALQSVRDEIVSLKAQTGQGINWTDIKVKLLPYVKYTLKDLENRSDLSIVEGALLKATPDVLKWLESLK